MKLIDAFNSFIKYKETYTLKKTVTNYRQSIYPLIKHLGLDIRLEDISQDKIYEYQTQLRNRGLSNATIATYMRQIKIFFKWCVIEYSADISITVDPCKIKLPKTYLKQVTMYTPEQIKDIFTHTTADKNWISVRNKLIIALMYDSGLRQNEVVNLEKKNISINDRNMIVTGKGNKMRTVPIGLLSLELYKEYLFVCPYESKYVFVGRRNTKLTGDAIKHLIYKISKRVSFEFSSHALRHNFATNYLLNQLEINGIADIYSLMSLMGHEEVETTRVYLHHAHSLYASKHYESQLDKIHIQMF